MDNKPAVFCIGSIHLDIFVDSESSDSMDSRGEFTAGVGGTAFNIATALLTMGCDVYFASVLKKGSLFTRLILYTLEKIRMRKDCLEFIDYIPDAGFFAMRNNGNLTKAVNSTPLENIYLIPSYYRQPLSQSDFISIDFNNSIPTISDLLTSLQIIL